MAKQAGRLRKLLRRVLRFQGRAFEAFKGGTMAKQAGRLRKLLRRVLRFRAFEAFKGHAAHLR